MNYNKNQRILLSIISSIIVSFFVNLYIVSVETQLNFANIMNILPFKKFILLSVISFFIFWILYNENLRKTFFAFVYKYRYPISFLIIAICTILQIHGSSINELNIFHINHHPLIGISRFMRSDEYGVNTLMAFSQYHNNFSYFSDIYRAVPTDMFIIYGQAILDIAVIFRPFNIGYLFLNQGMGLSFFWVSRFIILALISFECGMLITNKNKVLSLSYAILITLSPAVQWWFAINGLVEQLIFGQLGILLINWYMTTANYTKRLIYALLMVICIGGFLIVFYPSWQIPFAYVFILMALWIFLKNKNNFSYDKKDIILILASLGILAVIMIHILTNSLDTIKIILNTAYPGNEVFNAGGAWKNMCYYIASILFPLTSANIPINTVEHAVFIDFFPAPLILSLIVLFKQKTKDKLLIGLLALYLLFMIFFFVQLPDSIISITLRNHMKTDRLFVVISFISVLILIRSLAGLKEIADKKLIIIFSIILSAIMVYLSSLVFSAYYSQLMIIILLIVYAVAFSLLFLAHSDKGKIALLIGVICILFTAGALVNPIDRGTDVLFENDYIKEVQTIVNNDPSANWIVQDMQIDYLTISGAKTINSVNTYPDLNKWHAIDPNGENEEIYNRYAHIMIEFNNNTNTTFKLTSADLFTVSLNVNDLEKLNVTYIESKNSLEEFNNTHIKFENIYENQGYKIYKVNYI